MIYMFFISALLSILLLMSFEIFRHTSCLSSYMEKRVMEIREVGYKMCDERFQIQDTKIRMMIKNKVVNEYMLCLVIWQKKFK